MQSYLSLVHWNSWKKSATSECICVYLLTKMFHLLVYTYPYISPTKFLRSLFTTFYISFSPHVFLSGFQPASSGYPANNTTAFQHSRFMLSVHFHSGKSLDQIYQMQTILHRTSRHSVKILFPAPLLCTLTDSFSTGCVPKLG